MLLMFTCRLPKAKINFVLKGKGFNFCGGRSYQITSHALRYLIPFEPIGSGEVRFSKGVHIASFLVFP